MKKLTIFLLVASTLAAITSASAAFEPGKFYLGPSVGLAWRGLGLGVNGEYAYNKNWGFGGELSYTGFSDSYSGFGYTYKWKYTFVGGLAYGAYHFILKNNEKLDPFVKAGLGYFHWSADYSDNAGNTYAHLYGAGYSSGVGITGAAGIRYAFSPKLLGRLQVGYPFYISAGVDFPLGGK